MGYKKHIKRVALLFAVVFVATPVAILVLNKVDYEEPSCIPSEESAICITIGASPSNMWQLISAEAQDINYQAFILSVLAFSLFLGIEGLLFVLKKDVSFLKRKNIWFIYLFVAMLAITFYMPDWQGFMVKNIYSRTPVNTCFLAVGSVGAGDFYIDLQSKCERDRELREMNLL